jgi:hypothetical protein
MAPVCRECTWWQEPGTRPGWERATESESGFFGRALVAGESVIGWIQTAPATLVPRAQRLPAGPPSRDAYLLTCAYFYDQFFLHGFQQLLQDVEASLKQRRVAALEAFALLSTRPEDRFRGYIRELNLFSHEVLEGGGFRMVQRRGGVARYRLELATVIAVPRLSRAREQLETTPAAQPI